VASATGGRSAEAVGRLHTPSHVREDVAIFSRTIRSVSLNGEENAYFATGFAERETVKMIKTDIKVLIDVMIRTPNCLCFFLVMDF